MRTWCYSGWSRRALPSLWNKQRSGRPHASVARSAVLGRDSSLRTCAMCTSAYVMLITFRTFFNLD